MLTRQFERRNHLAGVDVVLWADVFALEEQLQLRGEVTQPIAGVKDGFVPRKANGRVAAIGPGVAISVADGDVELPGRVGRPSTPQVVLMRAGLQWSPSPWAEASVGCQPDLPRCQHGTEQWHVVSEHA